MKKLKTKFHVLNEQEANAITGGKGGFPQPNPCGMERVILPPPCDHAIITTCCYKVLKPIN